MVILLAVDLQSPKARRVLCVDDSSSALCLYKELLESDGAEVFLAPCGQAALHHLKEHAMDVAVIDNEMPEISGVELAQKMKRLQPQMRILMCSGSPPKDDNPDIDYILNKGSGIAMLLTAVRSLCAP